MHTVLEKILQDKIIAIIRGIAKENVVDLANAIARGGISCIEVTFDHNLPNGIENTISSIKMLKSFFGERIFLGAGTVLTTEQVQIAKNAGASFILSPNVDTQVIKKTKELDMISIPGAFTASEVVTSYNAGADIVKLFPISQVGSDYIKALKGPLSHIKFSAVGGVTEKNAVDFLKAGASCLGIGGNLASKQLVLEGRFYEIEMLAKEYIRVTKNY